MSTSTDERRAAEHLAELRGAAARARMIRSGSRERETATIKLRLCGAEDLEVVRRLAELDEAPQLAEPVLLALSDGHPVAALSLRDGRVVGDPFVPNRDAVALLRLRADQLSLGGRRRWLRGRAHLRPA